MRPTSLDPIAARHGAALQIALIALVAACRAEPAADGPCQCVPGNATRIKRADGGPFDSAALLGQLRRHRRDLAAQRNARDIKLIDDELRVAVTAFCQPCGGWVDDRAAVDAMFPLARLDDAVGVVCLGLVLGDGTTAWGNARPTACR